MDEQLRLQQLIDQLIAVQHNIIVIRNDSENSNVIFYLSNAPDYHHGLQRELQHALEAAEKE